MSRPRYMRGPRTCSPTARVTSRPERRISAAICTPVADAPTTITPPSPSWPALRYSIGVTVVTDDGTASDKAGTCATLNAPVARTTVWHRHSPWSVVTWYPLSVRRTDVTLVPDSTGAAIAFE